MNPKINLDELKKVQATNKELNRLNTQSEKIINKTNIKTRPITSKLERIKGNQSNIFNSDVKN